MKTFVWTVCIAMALELVAKLICLGRDYLPPRTKGGVAIDALTIVGVLIWGGVLLATA